MDSYTISQQDFVATIKFNIEKTAIDSRMGTVLKELATQIQVPGFRKGKVPSQIIKSRLGVKAVVNECVEEMLPELIETVVENEDLEPVSKPHLEKIENQTGDIVNATVKIELFPIIDVGDLKNLTITIKNPTVSDEDIKKEVEKQLKIDAELLDADVSKEIDSLDVVTVDLSVALKDSENLEPIYESSDIIIDFSEENQFEFIKDALIGHKLNEEVIGDMDSNGSPAQFKVVVTKIRSLKFPELTDDWVESNSDFKNKQELLDSIRKDLAVLKRKETLDSFNFELFNTFRNELNNKIHRSMIMDVTSQEYYSLNERLKQMNTSIEKYLRLSRMSNRDFEASLINRAYESIASIVLLRSIANYLNIEHSTSEIEDHMFDQISDKFNNDFDEFKKYMDNLKESASIQFKQLISNTKTELSVKDAFEWIRHNIKLVDEDGSLIDNSMVFESADNEEAPVTVAQSDSSRVINSAVENQTVENQTVENKADVQNSSNNKTSEQDSQIDEDSQIDIESSVNNQNLISNGDLASSDNNIDKEKKDETESSKSSVKLNGDSKGEADE